MPIYSAQIAKNTNGYLGPGIREGFVGEIDFIVSYAKKTGGPVLELACGAGRVMFELAKRSFEVYGIDASWPMIEIGKEAVKEFLTEVQSKIHFIQGDMRSFSFRKKFPLIIIPFNSFWFNLDKNGAEECLSRITDNLLPLGTFLIESPSIWDEYTQWWEDMAQKFDFTFKLELYSCSGRTGSGNNVMLIGTKN